jgi:hypothetical protein
MYLSETPYKYGHNNPVVYNDPTGGNDNPMLGFDDPWNISTTGGGGSSIYGSYVNNWWRNEMAKVGDQPYTGEYRGRSAYEAA